MDTADTPIEKPARRRGAGYWLAWVAGLLLGGSLLINGLLMLMVLGLSLDQPASEGADEQVILEGSGERRILVIPLDGVISEQREDGMFGERPSPVDHIVQQLAFARDDQRVAAVVLTLDTPGGGVTASDRIHRAISDFRAETGLPVIAHMGGLCASGGYYAAMACDRVSASPTTVTGSIGVIMSLMNAEILFTERLGIRATPIVSGEHKDLGSPFRAMSEEERALLQGIVDRMYGRFVDLVVANRSRAEAFSGLDEAAVRARILAVADGRVLHADQALEAGLVDDIRHPIELYQELRASLGIGDAPVIRYIARPKGLAALLEGAKRVDPVSQVTTSLDAALRPRFEYRWAPGLP